MIKENRDEQRKFLEVNFYLKWENVAAHEYCSYNFEKLFQSYMFNNFL